MIFVRKMKASYGRTKEVVSTIPHKTYSEKKHFVECFSLWMLVVSLSYNRTHIYKECTISAT